MQKQTMPDPIKTYEEAAKRTRRIVQRVKADQLTKPTPCTELNVQALMDHVIGAFGYVSGTIAGTKSGGDSAGKTTIQKYDEGVAGLLKAAKAPGALEKKVQGPGGEMTGAQMVFMGFMEALIHGWDLAKATGQDTKMDSKLAEIGLNVAKPIAEGARTAKAFGPEVKVPATASTQDKLLGLTGRKP